MAKMSSEIIGVAGEGAKSSLNVCHIDSDMKKAKEKNLTQRSTRGKKINGWRCGSN